VKDNSIFVLVTSVIGLFFVGNAVGEGGFKVLFDFPNSKYGGCRKPDIIISFLLGCSCFGFAIFKNNTVRDLDIMLGTAYTIVYWFCWYYSKKHKTY
jgi:hypothetical protein